MAPKFALQNVLDVRHSRVEALEIELGKLVAAEGKAREQLDMLRQYRAMLMTSLESNLLGDMDLFAVRRLQADLEEAANFVANAEEELARLTGQVEAKRRELIAARQAEEVLDVLKTKMIEDYQQEQIQRETRSQDDMYIARAFRSQPQGA